VSTVLISRFADWVIVGRDETTAKSILDQLEHGNIVKRCQRRKKGGRFGEFVFTLINNEAKLLRDYFCPISNIAHHVSFIFPLSISTNSKLLAS
jgi:hypothetical protein